MFGLAAVTVRKLAALTAAGVLLVSCQVVLLVHSVSASVLDGGARPVPVRVLAFGAAALAIASTVLTVVRIVVISAACHRMNHWVRAHRRPAAPRLLAAARLAGVRVPVVQVDSPGVFAWTCRPYRPRIVVGTELVECAAPAELVAVLRHEEHHARHGHPLARMIGEVVCAALWYLPVYRTLGRHLVLRQELAADAAALTRSDRGALAGAIYKSVSGPAESGVVASMATTKVLEARVRQLEGGWLPAGPRHCHDFWAGALTTLSVLAVLAVGTCTSVLGPW
ncbi:Protease HtpX [Amycolatopsis sp. YIM 10]|nr:Protease HtpX [Amycolatopsis sp. YIM 10]